MELTSKQRAQLRSLATNLDTIVHVGKDGIGDNLIKQVNDALEARELIKGRVLENSLLTAREAAEELAVAARCEVVLKTCCIGLLPAYVDVFSAALMPKFLQSRSVDSGTAFYFQNSSEKRGLKNRYRA